MVALTTSVEDKAATDRHLCSTLFQPGNLVELAVGEVDGDAQRQTQDRDQQRHLEVTGGGQCGGEKAQQYQRARDQMLVEIQPSGACCPAESCDLWYSISRNLR